jgi:hypothetical protein
MREQRLERVVEIDRVELAPLEVERIAVDKRGLVLDPESATRATRDLHERFLAFHAAPRGGRRQRSAPITQSFPTPEPTSRIRMSADGASNDATRTATSAGVQ